VKGGPKTGRRQGYFTDNSIETHYSGMYSWPNCELIPQLISPSKTGFCNLVEVSMKKITQNSISSTP